VRHLYDCQLRWADQDLLGHVNNVLYADYLQEARVDFLRTHSPATRLEDGTGGVVVVRHELSYVSSLHFSFAPVHVECWVSEVRAASFTMQYEVFSTAEDGSRQVHVLARSVLAPFDFATQSPRRLRPEEQAALAPFLEPGETLRALELGPPVAMPGSDYEVAVRFSDVDGYNHVNNVKYFEYFQESRIKLMRELGEGIATGGLHIVVARTQIDYVGQTSYRARPYACPSWVSRIGRTSIAYDSLLLDGDRTLARARVVGVCISSETSRPAEIPQGYREVVGSYGG